ncbi:hypothetical protein UNSWDHB_494 [Dehalobacter sp. UNSWDHB]|jgi:Protein of unknown function (DUF1638).|uniref:DUF1638 domain-containing protein n=1 Tax=unclassified Dehalobacter TaxID=2635733 RepID=UPI00028AE214|nr:MULTISPECIES: DUF1638 domain-containing protein [unclassified Dehalobacter]AFV03039.1 hypothetical protein DHBDCA_p2012 [Dehalobacter sp. DCA]AFV06027.1 hypothetical protein DCF50_p2024 [Dehalobacter sp. CF]EQB22179.1 hypothetical protein UNSWDHB_494 [Dehalobacter sp. UNSWDHB]
MGTIIVACQTIKHELNLAISETKVEYPIVFVDSGLHIYPDKLRLAIQDTVNRIDHVDTILMAFGYCGNGLLGIKAETARLIIPKAHDCISLLLGSNETRQKIMKEAGTYFLTKGWLEYERNILADFEGCVQRHGQKRALEVMKTLLHHYQRLMVIDTKAYESSDILKTTQKFADTIGLRHEEYPGSMRFLNKLLTGPWDEEFIILEQGQKMTFESMNSDNTSIKQTVFV